MDDLGRQLKRAREARGVSLRDIATRTKISITALEALERSEFHRLPGGIFSRAVVRAYAAEVGLDPDITVENFLNRARLHERETAERVAAAMPGVTHDDREFVARQARALRLLQVAAVLIAAGAVVLLVWQVRRVWAPGPPEEVPAPAADLAPPPPPPPAPTATEPAPEAPAVATPAPAAEPPVAGRGAGAAAGATVAPPEPAAPALAAKPEAAKVTAAEPAARSLVVELTAAADCQIISARDGGPSETYLLRAGTRYRLEAAQDLVLTVADAGAVSWTINGRRAQPLGKPGAEVRVRVTPANATEFLP